MRTETSNLNRQFLQSTAVWRAEGLTRAWTLWHVDGEGAASTADDPAFYRRRQAEGGRQFADRVFRQADTA